MIHHSLSPIKIRQNSVKILKDLLEKNCYNRIGEIAMKNVTEIFFLEFDNFLREI